MGIFHKKEYRLIIVGLEYGENDLFNYHIKGKKEIKEEKQKEKDEKGKNNLNHTIGLNIFDVKHGESTFTIWDLPNQEKTRILWKDIYASTDGIIYVMDVSDKDRLNEEIKNFEGLLSENELKTCPLLVMAKQDSSHSLSPDEVIKLLNMEKYNNIRQWLVKGISFSTGEGIKDGFDWLASQIITNK